MTSRIASAKSVAVIVDEPSSSSNATSSLRRYVPRWRARDPRAVRSWRADKSPVHRCGRGKQGFKGVVAGLSLCPILLGHVALDEARRSGCGSQGREPANHHNSGARRLGTFHQSLGNARGGLGSFAARRGGGDDNVGAGEGLAEDGTIGSGTRDVGDAVDGRGRNGAGHDGDDVAAADGFGDDGAAGVAIAAKNGDVCHVSSNVLAPASHSARRRVVEPTRLTAMESIRVFAGTGGKQFAEAMCAALDVPLSDSKVQRFANDCLEVQLLENVRERDVFLVQPIVAPTQENLVELLLMIDAARGASARRVTAVMPHFAYARSDKKDHPRISIGGRLMADMLVTAGANRVLTMTLHAPQVHAFFRIPTDQLHALEELASSLPRSTTSPTPPWSPQTSATPSPRAEFARLLDTPVAAGAKERFEGDRVTISHLIGDVDGRDVIVLDDEIANGTTIDAILDKLQEHGARRISIACTHGIFSNGALERIGNDPRVSEIVTTDTVPHTLKFAHPKLTVLSAAPAFAEAVRRIHSGESVSALFA